MPRQITSITTRRTATIGYRNNVLIVTGAATEITAVNHLTVAVIDDAPTKIRQLYTADRVAENSFDALSRDSTRSHRD